MDNDKLRLDRLEERIAKLEEWLTALEEPHEEGAREMLERVRASLKDYPNAGGDVVVMEEVERLMQEARRKALARAIGEAERTRISFRIWYDGGTELRSGLLMGWVCRDGCVEAVVWDREGKRMRLVEFDDVMVEEEAQDG